MWIVKLALRRPYTFVVMALLILVLGSVSIARMRTDIFPEIDIPVITTIWDYKGMDAEEFEKRITTFSGDRLIRVRRNLTLSGLLGVKRTGR